MLDLELLLGIQLTWNLSMLLFLVCIMCLYVLLLQRAKIGLANLRALLFLLGLLLFYIVAGSPFATISYLSFSLHMITMSILYFIVPPLILFGIPDLPKATEVAWLNWMKKLHLHPKAALYTFALLFLLYHMPFVLTFLLTTPLLQKSYLITLFVLAFGMWWPIASPDTNRRLDKRDMKRYAMTSGYVLLPACLFFILAALVGGIENPLFAQLTVHLCLPDSLSTVTLLPPPFNTKYDHFMSGIIMMGLHKSGLVMALALEGKIIAAQPKSEKNETYPPAKTYCEKRDKGGGFVEKL